jgi:DNA ligase (NAD+)
MGLLRTVTQAELEAIHGVGDVVAASFTAWMHEPLHTELLDALLVQVTPVAETQSAPGGTSLAGSTFVFTGTLPTLSRTEGEEMVRRAGGQVTSSVSRKTTYVVVGSDPGSKAEKAEELGVTVLDEAAFRALFTN